MARTPTVTRDQVPEQLRSAFDAETANSGGVITSGPGSVMIHSPEMRRRANSLVNYLRDDSSLSKKLQELTMILTAKAMDCQYIWHAHSARAREQGISDEFVDNLREGNRCPNCRRMNRPSSTMSASCSKTTESAKPLFRPLWPNWAPWV